MPAPAPNANYDVIVPLGKFCGGPVMKCAEGLQCVRSIKPENDPDRNDEALGSTYAACLLLPSPEKNFPQCAIFDNTGPLADHPITLGKWIGKGDDGEAQFESCGMHEYVSVRPIDLPPRLLNTLLTRSISPLLSPMMYTTTRIIVRHSNHYLQRGSFPR